MKPKELEFKHQSYGSNHQQLDIFMGIEWELIHQMWLRMVNPDCLCDVAITNTEACIKGRDLTNKSCYLLDLMGIVHEYGSPTIWIIWGSLNNEGVSSTKQ